MRTKVPANLADLDLAGLEALEAELIAEFDEQNDGDKDIAVMREVADALGTVREAAAAEQARLDEQQAEMDALRDSVHPAPADDADDDEADASADDDDDDDEADDDEAAASADDDDEQIESDTAGADDNEKEPVMAGSRGQRRSAPPSASRTRQTAREPEVPAMSRYSDVVITAAADVPGFTNGARIDSSQIAAAMHARARGLGDHSEQVPVASVTTGLPTAVQLDERSTDADIEAAVNEALSLMQPTAGRTGAESLVAAGGWCTPSVTLHDEFAIESRDGMFQLPTLGVSVTRGGIELPDFLTISDAAGALWTWSETTDATGELAASDIDVATNVATVTTSAAHNLAVGQTVAISGTGVANLDGDYTVASVVDADTFTVATTGVGDTTNQTGAVRAVKGCLRVPCPSWSNYRLEAEGLCITHGNLMNRTAPERTARFVDLAVTAHLHRVANAQFAKVLATADATTVTAVPSDAVGELFNAIDLEAAAFREKYLMPRSAVLEAVFPHWAPGFLRAVLGIRNGIRAQDVPEAEVIGWFTQRNLRPQFIYGYQPLDSGSTPQAWPATLKFTIYAAGSYVAADGGVIDLGVQRDSAQNRLNDFTLAWTEQFYLVGQRGPNARELTVTVPDTGVTGGFTAAGA